jgi:hypothetical protein
MSIWLRFGTSILVVLMVALASAPSAAPASAVAADTTYNVTSYAYDTRAQLSTPETGTVVARASPTGSRDALWARSVAVGRHALAAETAVGFADDAVVSAYQGMRSGGGRAIRHLRDEGLIANSGSLSSQVAEFEQLTSPILRAPTRTFDGRVGETMTRAFAAEAGVDR